MDDSDSVVKSYTYDAYGNTSTSGAFVNSFTYTGAVIDPETGLYYMNARYYDPQTGRFISQDSYRGEGESFWQLYAYCYGDPINFTDFTGHKPRWLSKKMLQILKDRSKKIPDFYKTFYGAAKLYKSIKGNNEYPNCYTYAVGRYTDLCNPGDDSGTAPKLYNDVIAVRSAVIEDLWKWGRWGRTISGPYSPILKDEYRIAVRVGKNKVPGKDYYDYHFMVQTSSGGAWAEKHGIGGNTILNAKGKTPADLSWDIPGVKKNYYNSSILYIAATYKKRASSKDPDKIA